ncbi:MAG TPA: cytochrome c peroxidase [Skermanella sp.]|nr:cytochrome c peroxidase [Skermanella sp.]
MHSGLIRRVLSNSASFLTATAMIAVWSSASVAQTAPSDQEAAEVEIIDDIEETEPEDEVIDAAEPDERPLESLKGKAPPLPDLTGIIKNKAWAQAAGKALFWDQQIGSDTVACASCHFRAGADPRITNQLNPGLNAGDKTFGSSAGTGLMASGQAAGPNITLKPEDFPFRKLQNPNNAKSAVLFDTNDVSASQGTYAGDYVGTIERPKQRPRATNTDRCKMTTDEVFNIAGHGTRKVEPRNTPSVINAVFYHRNFWDGRANNLFSGVGVFGRRDIRNDPAARLLVLKPDGSVALQNVRLDNASAASQAVGPLLSDFEMSCTSRAFADIGRKMMAQQALKLQAVSIEDSVFGIGGPVGDIVSASRIGLKHTYGEMIKQGFAKRFWAAPDRYKFVTNGDGTVGLVTDPAGYTQMELNFPLFFGLSVMLYEATLISDDSPFDRGQLTALQKRGKEIFEGKGKCIACHDGPLFSKAAHVATPGKQPKLVERMAMGDGKTSLYDNGFYNIGVRPVQEDLGVGGTDPWGAPLSFSKQWVLGRKADSFLVDPCSFDVPFPGQETVGCGGNNVPSGINLRDERLAVNGAFKTPTLRNIALTPPYFHNGGQATLQQVMAFYNRGGDFSSATKSPDITQLGLTVGEQDALVAFMQSLTDERVRCSRAPFDHPELLIPDGHKADTVKKDGRLADRLRVLNATGAAGYPANRCPDNTGNLFDMARNINGFPIK